MPSVWDDIMASYSYHISILVEWFLFYIVFQYFHAKVVLKYTQLVHIRYVQVLQQITITALNKNICQNSIYASLERLWLA